MTKILALDLATKTGHYTQGDKKAHTAILDATKPHSRFVELYSLMVSLLDGTKVTDVVYEQAAFQQGMAGVYFHGYVAILHLVCWEYKVKLHKGIAVGTIKKAFCGSGKASKKEIMKRCDNLGIKYDDDNGSDAYAIYHTHCKIIKRNP